MNGDEDRGHVPCTSFPSLFLPCLFPFSRSWFSLLLSTIAPTRSLAPSVLLPLITSHLTPPPFLSPYVFLFVVTPFFPFSFLFPYRFFSFLLSIFPFRFTFQYLLLSLRCPYFSSRNFLLSTSYTRSYKDTGSLQQTSLPPAADKSACSRQLLIGNCSPSLFSSINPHLKISIILASGRCAGSLYMGLQPSSESGFDHFPFWI